MEFRGHIGLTTGRRARTHTGISWIWDRSGAMREQLRGRPVARDLLMRHAPAVVVGAGAMYLFDPVSGARRRHMLRDRSLATMRRALDRLVGAGIHAGDRVQGALHELLGVLPLPGSHADEELLAQQVRTQLRQVAPDVAERVGVKVESGQAFLHGSLSEDEARRMEEIVRRVPGIRQVRTLSRA